MVYGYNTDCNQIANFEADRARYDFEYIFSANAIEVELIKQRTDIEVEPNGDFFGTKEKPIVERQIIQLFVTAEATNAYKRAKAGITTNDVRFKGYAKWNAPIDNNDMVKFLKTTSQTCFGIKPGEVFIIEDFNKPFYKGQYTWQEFTLKRVDHDDQFVKRSPR